MLYRPNIPDQATIFSFNSHVAKSGPLFDLLQETHEIFIHSFCSGREMINICGHSVPHFTLFGSQEAPAAAPYSSRSATSEISSNEFRFPTAGAPREGQGAHILPLRVAFARLWHDFLNVSAASPAPRSPAPTLAVLSQARDPAQPEFLQAVTEVRNSQFGAFFLPSASFTASPTPD